MARALVVGIRAYCAPLHLPTRRNGLQAQEGPHIKMTELREVRATVWEIEIVADEDFMASLERNREEILKELLERAGHKVNGLHFAGLDFDPREKRCWYHFVYPPEEASNWELLSGC
jgi:hypothetical protein